MFLLIERFDCAHVSDRWQRKTIVSALTLLGLDEMLARYANYEDPTEMIRYRFKNRSLALRELFYRRVFNIVYSNSDDHAHNHPAFWNGGNN